MTWKGCGSGCGVIYFIVLELRGVTWRTTDISVQSTRSYMRINPGTPDFTKQECRLLDTCIQYNRIQLRGKHVR
jgi:hypothetical protein